jgi:ribosomal protein S18 acetylase RimI-like enzyme
MSENFTVRQATAHDISEILEQRKRMYQDMGHTEPEALLTMVETTRPFLEQAIPAGTLRGWLATMENRIVAGGAVLLSPWPSHTYDGECRRATILNVYTYPEFRRRGIARHLMCTMIEWCRSHGLAMVYLHASNDGRALYESLGFEPTAEMRLKLR